MAKSNRAQLQALSIAVTMLTLAGCSEPAFKAAGAARQGLTGYIRPEIAAAPVEARLPPGEVINLTIDLPIADPQGLGGALEGDRRSGSPSFQQFITPAQFADRFGASEADYRAVADWARANNLKVATHANRLVLEVSGAAADVEEALQVRFNYGLRPDGTRFRGPDREPSLALAVPIEGIEHLDDFDVDAMRTGSSQGTGPSSDGGPSVTAIDIRNGYLWNTVLNGTGQTVGVIVNGSGCFNQSDIDAYVALNNLQDVATVLPVATALADSHCSGGQLPAVELTMDIEMVTAVAPGAQIVVAAQGNGTNAFQYFADHGDPSKAGYVAQVTSSYSWKYVSASATGLAQMAANGQSFFTYSGDSGAYTSQTVTQNDFLAPSSIQAQLKLGSDLPFTLAGGTFLFMNGANYTSEEAWGSVDGGQGSGGGILSPEVTTAVAIPAYQSSLLAGGTVADGQVSKQYRNSPDVSAIASNVEEIITNSGGPAQVIYFHGTSAASPLWAGFTALVNQLRGQARGIGFANSLLYANAASFNDVATGSNPSFGCDYDATCDDSSSTAAACACFTSVKGYDLATGLGTPNPYLLNALANASACQPYNTNSHCPPVITCSPGSAFCTRTQTCLLIGQCPNSLCPTGEHFCLTSNSCVPQNTVCSID